MRKPFKVPGDGIVVVDTPSTWQFMKLLGTAGSYEGVSLSKDQDRNLREFYDIDDQLDVQAEEEQRERAEALFAEQLAAWEAVRDSRNNPEVQKPLLKAYREKYRYYDVRKKPEFLYESSLELARAGSSRNMHRHWKRDGLRIMAFLAKYLEQGQDPVKFVAQLAIEAGFDVPDDYNWIFDLEVPDDT